MRLGGISADHFATVDDYRIGNHSDQPASAMKAGDPDLVMEALVSDAKENIPLSDSGTLRSNSDAVMDSIFSADTESRQPDAVMEAMRREISTIEISDDRVMEFLIEYSTGESIDEEASQRNFVGRPSLSQVPGVVDEVRRILCHLGAEASEKRRNQTIGVNLELGISSFDLRDHLFETIPEVRERFPRLSHVTVRRLGIAPKRNLTAASNYHAVVPFKVISCTNDAHKIDENSHECFSQVGLIKEEIYYYERLCGDEVHGFSVDNATSLRIGECDSVHTPPHDFCSYTVTPSGYLKYTCPETADATFAAPDGRKHVVTPHMGKLYLYLRADYFHNATIATHYEDIKEIFGDSQPGFVFVLSDRGPDWSIQHDITFIYYGLLWYHLRCDGFVITSYAADNSAFNDIEKSWSFICDALGGGLKIDGKLNGKDPTTDAERASVLDRAIEDIAVTLETRYSKMNKPFKCVRVRSTPNATSSSEKQQWELFYDLKHYSLEAFKEKLNLYRLFVSHCVRLPNYILFLRCVDPNCRHCSQLGDAKAPNLIKTLRQRGGFFAPMPSTTHSGHYKSFLEMKDADSFCKPVKTAQGDVIDYCTKCSMWAFHSAAEKKKHYRIVHDENFKPTSFRCNFADCGLEFPTATALRSHKESQKPPHIKRRRKVNELSEKERIAREKRRVKAKANKEAKAKALKSLGAEPARKRDRPSKKKQAETESSSDGSDSESDEEIEDSEIDEESSQDGGDLSEIKPPIRTNTKSKRTRENPVARQLVPNGSLIQVWFQDKKRYFKGTIVGYDKNSGLHKIRWQNNRREDVDLRVENMTDDVKNLDRWNYILSLK